MQRDIDINEVSDGKLYHANDLVRISCRDCEGCSNCCHDMGRSIILDPYDIYMLTTGLHKSFDELLSDNDNGIIELSMVDSLLLPNLRMDDATNACSFLSSEGRCTIHAFRPGLCRMFPLGRIWDGDSFSYFNQIHECPFPDKSKIKIKKWLGFNNISAYERFITKWHAEMERERTVIAGISDNREITLEMVNFLKCYYKDPYDTDSEFPEQFETRLINKISL